MPNQGDVPGLHHRHRLSQTDQTGWPVSGQQGELQVGGLAGLRAWRVKVVGVAVDRPQPDVAEHRPKVGEHTKEQTAVAADDQWPPPVMSSHACP